MKYFPVRGILAGVMLLLGCSGARAQYLDHYFNPRDASLVRLSGVPTFGRSAGMGYLEFAVPDSLRDPWVNPAKQYGRASTLFAAPYVRRMETQNGSYEFTTQFGQIVRTYRFRSRGYAAPAGGIWRGKGWYGGGYIGFADFFQTSFRRVTADDFLFERRIRVGSSGWPFSLLAGGEPLPGLRVGASYSSSRQSFYEYDNLTNPRNVRGLTQQDQYLRAGAHLELGRGRAALMGSVYRRQYELRRNQGFSNNDKTEGLFLQGEYHREMGSRVTLSGRIGYEKREQQVVYRFEDTVGYTTYDNGKISTWQLGLGMVKRFPGITVAVEADYEPSRFDYAVDRSEETVRQWTLRGGVDAPLGGYFNGQFGLSHQYYRMKRIESVVQSRSGGIDELNPAIATTWTRLTGGLSWRRDRLELMLHASYSTYTTEIRLNNDLNSDIITPFTTRLLAVYYL